MAILKKDIAFSTLLVFVVMSLAPILFSPAFLSPVRASIYDFKITDIVSSTLRDAALIPPDTNIILINTDKLTNGQLAALITKLNEKQPKVIGVKIHLKKSANADEDSALSRAIVQADRIVISYRLTDIVHNDNNFDSVMHSDDLFRNDVISGYDNLITANDEKLFTIREFVTKTHYENKTVYPFSFMVAQAYDSGSTRELLKRNNNPETINYLGVDKFSLLEFQDFMTDNHELQLKNKIILLGKVSEVTPDRLVLEDVFFTPLNKTYTGKSYPDMYGLTVQANIISMITQKRYINSTPDWMVTIFTILLIATNMMVFYFLEDKYEKWYEITSLAAFVLESLAILALTMYCFDKFYFELKTTVPIFALALSIPLFEMYNSTIKPITIRLYHKLSTKGKKP